MIVEELEAIDFEFALVSADPDGVDTADENRAEGDYNAHSVCGFHWCASGSCWLLIVVRDQGNTEAHWDQRIGGHAWYCLFVEEEVDYGDARGEEDSGDLVECDGRDLQGEVHANYVHGHGDSKWHHILDADTFVFEHAERRAGEDVESTTSDEEVEGGEGGLTLGEGFV